MAATYELEQKILSNYFYLYYLKYNDMITLSVLFIIVYIICIAAFFMMPKRAFNDVIKRYMDKDFDVANLNNLKNINTGALNYYKIVLAGAAVTAALITFILKLIFY